MREVFVFGSNLAGRHGAGAAVRAVTHYGAQQGVGHGMTGDAYALPTKDLKLQTMPVAEVEMYVRQFVEFARANPDVRFLLTPVGTGLAGINKREIWAMLARAKLPGNVVLTASWINKEART